MGGQGHCVCEVVCMVCMGGQGHWVCEVVCMGGQLGRIPSILSIPDTVSVRWYVWGDNSGGSRVYLVYSGHCVCEVVCMGGQLGRIPSILSIFRTLCL